MVNEMKHTYPAFLAASVVICTAIAQYLIYFYAPVEQTLGYAQKYFIIIACRVVGFRQLFLRRPFRRPLSSEKEENFNILSHANAEVGFLLATLTLITGSLWGKHSWGVWWTWDPKLTTALILWFIFAAYLVIRTMPMPREQKNNIAAVIAIIGFLDVPLVFFATRLWRSIHPAVFHSEGGGLEPAMAHTVVFCVLSFAFIWLWLVRYRKQQLSQELKLETLKTKLLYQEEQE